VTKKKKNALLIIPESAELLKTKKLEKEALEKDPRCLFFFFFID
jgi:hypothetical protein